MLQRSWMAAVLLLFQQTLAHACSCGGFEDLQTVLPTVPLIFKGEIVKTEVLANDESPTWDGTPMGIRTTFKIKEVVKGKPHEGQQIYSQNEPYMCGVDFPRMVGQIVTIAAFEENGKAFTGLCLFTGINITREEPRRRRR